MKSVADHQKKKEMEMMSWWLKARGVNVPEEASYEQMFDLMRQVARKIKKERGIQDGEPVGWV